VEKIEKA
jgi:hypothetical protein